MRQTALAHHGHQALESHAVARGLLCHRNSLRTVHAVPQPIEGAIYWLRRAWEDWLAHAAPAQSMPVHGSIVLCMWGYLPSTPFKPFLNPKVLAFINPKCTALGV